MSPFRHPDRVPCSQTLTDKRRSWRTSKSEQSTRCHCWCHRGRERKSRAIFVVRFFRSFGFELQGPRSAFTSWRARIRYPKMFSLPAHKQKLVLGHVTFLLQQHFQFSLERCLCCNHRIEGLLHIGGQSSASMFCHFNSSRAIVLLHLGRTKRHDPIRDQCPQSSSASRVTAGASGFLNFSQSGDLPET